MPTSANIIDGNAIARALREEVAARIKDRVGQGLRPPGLAALQERQPFEQVHVLLVLQQGAVQLRQRVLRVGALVLVAQLIATGWIHRRLRGTDDALVDKETEERASGVLRAPNDAPWGRSRTSIERRSPLSVRCAGDVSAVLDRIVETQRCSGTPVADDDGTPRDAPEPTPGPTGPACSSA